MLDSNTILGVRGYLKCEEYEHGVITIDRNSWPCGTPVVFEAGLLEEASALNVLPLMASANGAGRHPYFDIRSRSLRRTFPKLLCGNHEVLSVNEFDQGKSDRIIEFVKDVGGISLIIESESGRKSLPKGLKKFIGSFSYPGLFYYDMWSNKNLLGKDDRFVCVLTFLDLPYCLPIFNMRKANGIGLSVRGLRVVESRLNGYPMGSFRADFICSEFKDNIFTIDGVSINGQAKISKSTGIFSEIGQQVAPKLKTVEYDGPTEYKYEKKKKKRGKGLSLGKGSYELKSANYDPFARNEPIPQDEAMPIDVEVTEFGNSEQQYVSAGVTTSSASGSSWTVYTETE